MGYIAYYGFRGPNGPKSRVYKGNNGLWNVELGSGHWIGASGDWATALKAATTGRWEF